VVGRTCATYAFFLVSIKSLFSYEYNNKGLTSLMYLPIGYTGRFGPKLTPNLLNLKFLNELVFDSVICDLNLVICLSCYYCFKSTGLVVCILNPQIFSCVILLLSDLIYLY
jgi:hypothetical protein